MSCRRHCAADGFTLVETLGVVILIGLLAAMAGMAVFGLYNAGQDKQAIAAAQSINQAQQIYLLRVSGAQQNWTNASGDDSKFNLLLPYLPATSATNTLETYEPSGYQFQFSSQLTSEVTINCGGRQVPY